MTQQEIIEGNKLIAEFMGFLFDESKTDDHKFYSESTQGGWTSKRYVNPKYHSSWDWLMPVVEKINETCKNTGYVDDIILFDLHIVGCAISDVWQGCIDYIRWFNTQSTNPLPVEG